MLLHLCYSVTAEKRQRDGEKKMVNTYSKNA